VVILFLLSITLSRVCRVSVGSDSSPSVSSGVKSSAMVVGGRGRGREHGRGCNRDSGGGHERGDKFHVIVFTAVETIIH